MGGYKDIFLYLYENSLLELVDFLSFANDSIQFIPGKWRWFNIKYDFEKKEYSALFTHKSFEGGPHTNLFLIFLVRGFFK